MRGRNKTLMRIVVSCLLLGAFPGWGASPITSIKVVGIESGELVLDAYPAEEYMYNAYPVKVIVEPEDANLRSLKLVTDLDDDPDGPIVKASYQKADKVYEFITTPFGSLLSGNAANYTDNERYASMWASYDDLSAYKTSRSCTAWFEATDGSGVKSDPFQIVVIPRDREPLADSYQEGTFWLNEEWFGHTNGSINYITRDGEIKYRVFESQNPAQAFGCTSQYGMIYGGRLYIVSKQQSDNGDRFRFGGGRLVIADATTLRRITSFDEIGTTPGEGAVGPNGSTMMGDGRACVGVSPDKIYIGHHKGIRVLNIDLEKAESKDEEVTASAFTLGNEIKIGDDKLGLDEGQVGDMICTGPYVFAVTQSNGLLVIDAETDRIVKTLGTKAGTSYAVQGVARSADGHVWFAETISTEDKTFTSLVEVDPFSAEIISKNHLPEGAGKISTGWGAWRSTNFIASKKKNVLYWASVGSGYQDAILGASPGEIYRWEIGSPLPETPYFQLGKRPGKDEDTFQVPYATMGYDDRTDEVVFATTHGASYNYRYEWIYKIDGVSGEINYCQQLRPYFWFPAMPIFPDRYAPEFVGLDRINVGEESLEINLFDCVRDFDGGENHICFSIEPDTKEKDRARGIKNPFFYSDLNKGILTITPVSSGSGEVRITAVSNGKTVSKIIPVTVEMTTGVGEMNTGQCLRYSSNSSSLMVEGFEGRQLRIFDMNGRLLEEKVVLQSKEAIGISFPSGVYVAHISSKGISVKFIVKR